MDDRPSKCGLCGGPAQGSPRSHIFPEWLGREIQGENTALLSVPTTPDGSPRRINSFGLWQRIVCLKCEESFKAADDYFLAFYKNRNNAQVLIKQGIPVHVYGDADPFLLKRFFWTCLLRAQLAKKQQRDVDLGPYESNLQQALLDPRGEALHMGMFIVRETHKYARAIGICARESMGNSGAKFYRIYVPGFVAVVKADKREVSEPLASLLLRPGFPVVAIEQDQPSVGIFQGLKNSVLYHGDKASRIAASTRPKTT